MLHLLVKILPKLLIPNCEDCLTIVTLYPNLHFVAVSHRRYVCVMAVSCCSASYSVKSAILLKMSDWCLFHMFAHDIFFKSLSSFTPRPLGCRLNFAILLYLEFIHFQFLYLSAFIHSLFFCQVLFTGHNQQSFDHIKII